MNIDKSCRRVRITILRLVVAGLVDSHELAGPLLGLGRV